MYMYIIYIYTYILGIYIVIGNSSTYACFVMSKQTIITFIQSCNVHASKCVAWLQEYDVMLYIYLSIFEFVFLSAMSHIRLHYTFIDDSHKTQDPKPKYQN